MPASWPFKKRTGRPAEIDPGKLLDVAVDLFAEHGFEGTTTRKLATQSGCNVAMIAYHFGSKEGLYQAAIERHFQRVRATYESAKALNPEELSQEWPEFSDADQRQVCASLYEVGKTIILENRMHRIICRELMSGGTKIAEMLSKSDVGILGPLHDSLKALIARHKLKSELDTRLAAISLVGPLLYSNISAPLIAKVFGLQPDQAYVRRLCVYLTSALFKAWET